VAEDDTNTTLSDDFADPSPAPETTTETPPSSGNQTSDTQDAPSSGDTPLSDRQGLLEAVRAVVKTQETPALPTEGAATQGETPDTAGTAPGETGDPKPDVTPPPPAADPTADELRKLRPETRRRFEQLLAQRDEARVALNTLQPEIEQHRQLQGYLKQHQLAPDDVNMLLGVGAALRRGDYQAFLNGVTPYVQAAQEAIGLRLAPDMQRQVDEGLITEETAREVTRIRFRANQSEERLREETTSRAQEDQGRALEAVRMAVTNWENDIRTRDPDYSLKANAVRRFSQALLQEKGAPTTPDQAVALVREAYAEATGEFARLRPAPRPTRPAPSGINGTSHGAMPEPTNMKDAVLLAMSNMRRAS
jgi:hypothetical protein